MTPLNLGLIILLLLIVFFYKQPIQLGFAPNDIRTYSYRISSAVSTSSPCAIRSPLATSTIEHASLDIKTATTAPITFEIAKSPSANATTTLLGSLTLKAGTIGALVATSGLQTNDNLIIAPNNWVNVRVDKQSSTTPIGSCEAIFRVIS